MDNFNEMFEDNNDEILKIQQEAENQTRISAIRDQLARANYNSIIEHGIDTKSLEDVEPVKRVLVETLEYFEDLEEYEKCAKLKIVIDSL